MSFGPSPSERVTTFQLVAQRDAAAVADWVSKAVLDDRLQSQVGGSRPLGLATGRTMEPIYARLVERVAGQPPVDQARLRRGWLSFNLDEYVGLAAADPRSFMAEMARHLVGPLGLEVGAVRLPDGTAPDPQAEAQRYAAAVAAAGGIGLQLLGLGLNGHVGFNEPPCSPESRCRCLHLSAATRLQNAAAFGGDATAVPTRAITLGLVQILAARRLVLVVTGAAKAAVLRRLLQEPASAQLPASWLRRHPDCTLVVDQAALDG
ncbi:glucosamine-6-phosphate deaminase [Synechococcus sp. CBW1002]|uniref:glucosamine-6-phosphate deaminase n=1 Tax=Synechococcus sp. CBW1002 TaxID=1353134 RepID=UPI00351C7737